MTEAGEGAFTGAVVGGVRGDRVTGLIAAVLGFFIWPRGSAEKAPTEGN